jgi:hypothetical protein
MTISRGDFFRGAGHRLPLRKRAFRPGDQSEHHGDTDALQNRRKFKYNGIKIIEAGRSGKIMESACKESAILNANDFRDINPGDRLLMGPGPSDVPARTLQAIAAHCIGHLAPYFLAIMNEVQKLLRFLFQTDNELTIPVSGTGSAGMETVLKTQGYSPNPGTLDAATEVYDQAC